MGAKISHVEMVCGPLTNSTSRSQRFCSPKKRRLSSPKPSPETAAVQWCPSFTFQSTLSQTMQSQFKPIQHITPSTGESHEIVSLRLCASNEPDVPQFVALTSSAIQWRSCQLSLVNLVFAAKRPTLGRIHWTEMLSRIRSNTARNRAPTCASADVCVRVCVWGFSTADHTKHEPLVSTT